MNGIKTARLGIAAAGCAFAAFSAQAVTITVDKVQQRWPWNNKVDITYTIAGDDTDTVLDSNNAKVVFTTVVNGNTYTFETGPNENVWNGTHTITWEGAPSGVKSANCKMSAAYYTEAVPTGDDYMIVEVRTGNVTYEGLGSDEGRIFGSATAQEIANSRYNNIKQLDTRLNRVLFKYKTTHMPLRKIAAGTQYTGDNHANAWNVPNDFYIQVFQYTNYQYWDAFDMVSSGRNYDYQQDERPRAMRWNDIRGGIDPTVKPEPGTSDPKNVVRWINGRTRGKVAGTFDLPTDIMQEMACRAGRGSWWFWGDNGDLFPQYVSYGNGITFVGTKLPNDWGLYDMVGLNWQWCLDVLNGSRSDASNPFSPMLGDSSQRVVFGCDCNGSQKGHFYADRRSDANPSSNEYAFRLAYYPPAE